MATLPELLKTMVEQDGSDLHIATNTPPQIRVHGHLHRLDLPELQPADTSPFQPAKSTLAVERYDLLTGKKRVTSLLESEPKREKMYASS